MKLRHTKDGANFIVPIFWATLYMSFNSLVDCFLVISVHYRRGLQALQKIWDKPPQGPIDKTDM